MEVERGDGDVTHTGADAARLVGQGRGEQACHVQDTVVHVHAIVDVQTVGVHHGDVTRALHDEHRDDVGGGDGGPLREDNLASLAVHRGGSVGHRPCVHGIARARQHTDGTAGHVIIGDEAVGASGGLEEPGSPAANGERMPAAATSPASADPQGWW